jgi:hypothetical protein
MRNIQTQAVGEPLTGSVQGGSANNIPVLEVDTFSYMKNVMPAATQIITDVMGVANKRAFNQGVADQASDMKNMGTAVDSAAALIKDSSWATRDAYSQGVAYQQYSEGQLETQQSILAQGAESAAAGESIAVFSQKIKPQLAKLNSTINSLGLDGEARAAAQEQLVKYTVDSQVQYQKQYEAAVETEHNVTVSKLSSAGVQHMMLAPDALSSESALRATGEQIYAKEYSFNSVKANDNASKAMVGTLEQMLTNINPSSSVDMERMRGYSSYLRSDSSDFLTPKARAKMSKLLTTSFDDVALANTLTAENSIRSFETQHAVTGGVDQNALQQLASQIYQFGADQRLPIGSTNSMLNRLNSLSNTVSKTMGDKENTLNADLQERALLGIKDTKQAEEAISASVLRANQIGRPEAAGMLTVEHGLSKKNYKTVAKGYDYTVAGYASAMSKTPDEFSKAPDALAQKTFIVDKAMYTTNVRTNDAYSTALQAKAWNTHFGADGGATMSILMSDPSVTSIEDVLGKWSPTLERVTADRVSGALNKTTVSIEDMSSGMFGRAFDFVGNPTHGAALGKEADDNIRAVSNRQVNQLLRANMYTALGAYSLVDGKTALNSMRAEGLILTTDYGTAIISKNARNAIGGGQNASDALVNSVDTELRNKALVALGGDAANASLENMIITYKDNGATVQPYTDKFGSGGDTPLAAQYFTWDQLATTGQQVLESERKVTKPIGKVAAVGLRQGHLGNSVVYADVGSFGSNRLKQNALEQIAIDEGYFDTPTVPEGRSDVVLAGHSVSKSTYTDMWPDNKLQGEVEWNNFVNAAKDPNSKEYGTLYNNFIDNFYKPFPALAAKAGLSLESTVNMPTTALTVLASTYYHGPASANVMAAAMNSVQEGGSIQQAIISVKNTDAYKQAGAARQSSMLNAVISLR